MRILSVENLCKKYEKFELSSVSFSLEAGKITGFIGRNGAGKSTTLKSMLNFIHADSGNIQFFGKNYSENEYEIKQNIGFVSGGINYYPKKKIKTITDTTKRFYSSWDDVEYNKYLQLFKLDENKTPDELSEGMKVKYALTLALSHHAKLLILDEPTSGLDPVSREELLDIFLLLSGKGVTILFSTHITSDIEKCADNIIYIKEGQLLASKALNDFVEEYKLAELPDIDIAPELKSKLIGLKQAKNGQTALVKTSDLADSNINVKLINANLESIMIHLEHEEVSI